MIRAGVELACCCNMRLSAPDVTFRVPAARMGIVYHHAGIARIRSVFGDNLAARLLVAGMTVTAKHAHGVGAVEVFPREHLRDEGLQLAHELRNVVPHAAAAHRSCLRALAASTFTPDAILEHERARKVAYASSEYRDKLAALRGIVSRA